jgi:hypothetical protein
MSEDADLHRLHPRLGAQLDQLSPFAGVERGTSILTGAGADMTAAALGPAYPSGADKAC